MGWKLITDFGDDLAIAARSYVIASIKAVKPDSQFDLSTRELRSSTPEDSWLEELTKRAYSGLLLEQDGIFIGRLFFQHREDNRLHMFSIVVEDDFQGRGYATEGLYALFEHGRHQKVAGFKLGDGKNAVMRGLYEHLARLAESLGLVFESVDSALVSFRAEE